MRHFQHVKTIYNRELAHYFETPVAYVFIVIFLILNGTFTFYLGNFFERNQADLEAFFSFHPWLYLFLVPALSMRLWAEERKTGSIELLLTYPITLLEAVVGKFLAAWVFTGFALVLTFPIWITVNYLGRPDNAAILTSYFGSWLMAGGLLAIGCCISATTKNQVIAFILSLVVSFVFLLSGYGVVLEFFHGWAPQWLVEAIASFSLLTHFQLISKGVLDVWDLTYFVVLIAVWLYACAVVVEMKKT